VEKQSAERLIVTSEYLNPYHTWL